MEPLQISGEPTVAVDEGSIVIVLPLSGRTDTTWAGLFEGLDAEGAARFRPIASVSEVQVTPQPDHASPDVLVIDEALEWAARQIDLANNARSVYERGREAMQERASEWWRSR